MGKKRVGICLPASGNISEQLVYDFFFFVFNQNQLILIMIWFLEKHGVGGSMH